MRRASSARRGRSWINWSAKTASASCMLGRPYHHDPGLNHEIMDEFQKLGYPIFSQSTLPLGRGSARAAVRRGSAGGSDQAIRSISTTSGRTPTPPARTIRSGPQSSRPAIPTWLPWKYPISNAGMMLPSTASSKGSSRSRARRTSASRTSMKTNPPDRSGFVSRRSTISCGAIGRQAAQEQGV